MASFLHQGDALERQGTIYMESGPSGHDNSPIASGELSGSGTFYVGLKIHCVATLIFRMGNFIMQFTVINTVLIPLKKKFSFFSVFGAYDSLKKTPVLK